MSNPQVQGQNQFGEAIILTLLQTPNSLQALANAFPPKAGVTSIPALGTVTIALSTSNTYTDAAVNVAVNAALATIVSKLNAVLAAMKVSS